MGSGQTSSSMVMAVILHALVRRKRAQVESYLQVFQEVVEVGGSNVWKLGEELKFFLSTKEFSLFEAKGDQSCKLK